MKKILLSYLLLISMALNAQIDLGMGGSTAVGSLPISTAIAYCYSQQIFTKQEINANTAENITGLKFYMNPSMSISNSSNWVVYLGHTSKASFTSDTDWIPVSQLTQAYSGIVTNVDEVVEITFATPFLYNNTDNLVIAVEEKSAGHDNNEVFYVYNTTPNSIIIYGDNDNSPNPASPPTGYLADTKSVITLKGLTLSPNPICPLVTYPTNNGIFIPLTPTITWDTSLGATSYKVTIGTTPGGTDIVNQLSVTSNSFVPSTPLSPNTNYYLKVTAVGPGGESSGCLETVFKTAPPPPTNDDCSGAVTLTVNPDFNCSNVTSGSTLGATDSGFIPDPCSGEPDDDVWYKFIATADSHRISLNNVNSVGSIQDSEIYYQLFSGTCGTLSSYICPDDPSMPLSGLISGLTVGETYYIRVYSYNGAGSNQSFDICISTLPPTPVNDDCSGALPAVTFPYSYTQSDAVAATNNVGFIDACPNNSMNDGTWFTFVGDGSTVTVAVSMPVTSNFDPQIGVYSGSCGNLSCEETVDDEGGGTTETISIPTLSGNTYYVNVGHNDDIYDYPEDVFTINISKNSLGTSEVSGNKNNILLYPNPFDDVLNVCNAENVKSASISDVSGRLVKTIDNPPSTLSVGDLKSGLYLVTLNMKNGSKQTIKMIKK